MMNSKDIACSHCGGPVPREAQVYRIPSLYKKVVSGNRTIFCCKGHGTAYRHANLTPEQKMAYHNKIAATRRGRSPEEKLKSRLKIRRTRSKFSAEKQKYISDRVKKTTLENHGSYDGIVKKRNKTLNSLYGKDHQSEFKIRRAKTNLERYGVENVWSSGSASRKKMAKTMKERYGVEHSTKNKDVMNRVKETYSRNHGGVGFASNTTRAKFEKTMLEEYGVKNAMHESSIRDRAVASFMNGGNKKSIETKRKNGTLPSQVSWKGHETKKRNGTYSTNSKEQYLLRALVSLYGHDIEYLYRGHPNYPWEADFYNKRNGTIMEYQGYFTHGNSPFDPSNTEHQLRLRKLEREPEKWSSVLSAKVWADSDVRKRGAAKKHGIPFVEWFNIEQFHGWYELEIAKAFGASRHKDRCFRIGGKYLVSHDSKYLNRFKEQIVYFPWDNLSKIKRMFEPKEQYYARKSEVVAISKERADKFCEKFHLQGSCRGTTLSVGIVVEQDGKKMLAGVMTFGRPRYNKGYDYELLRMCFARTVVGGASKMWKFALSKIPSNSSVISYCDQSKFSGDIYETLGFKRISKRARPSVHWYNPSTGQRISDNLLRKHGFDRLVGRKIGVEFGKNSSNETLMKKHGFFAVQDQGQITFIFEGQK